VFPDVPAAIAELRQRGVVVGICSNWDWDLDRHLAHNGIADLVDFVVCSAQIGYRKPHPAIVGTVLDRAGTTPDETLFVGDNWHDDIVGAGRAGLTPVHIVRAGSCGVVDHADVACTSGLGGIGEVSRVDRVTEDSS
jgi:putative hydrolase of the HAD superfamily